MLRPGVLGLKLANSKCALVLHVQKVSSILWSNGLITTIFADETCLCLFSLFMSCLWVAILPCLLILSLNNISRHACFHFGACLYSGGGGGSVNFPNPPA